MAVSILMRRERGRPGLHPASAHDDETLAAVPFDLDFTATLTQKRSQKQNAFYWTLLGKVVANHAFYQRDEQLHLWLKTRLGYIEAIEFHDGTSHMRVSSTAFDRMDGLAMRTYMDLALSTLCAEVIPGMDSGALLGEVEAMLGMTYDALFPLEDAA